MNKDAVYWMLCGLFGFIGVAWVVACSLVGWGTGALSFGLLSALSPRAHPGAEWQALLAAVGAMLGGGCGLVALVRAYWPDLWRSEKAAVRALTKRLDNLLRAVRRPR